MCPDCMQQPTHFRLNIKKLQANAAKAGKTEADVNRIISAGRVEGDFVIIPVNAIPHLYGSQWKSYVRPNQPLQQAPIQQPPPLPKEVQENPGLMQMAKSFGFSIYRWAQNGFKLASEAEEKERQKICGQCPHWKPDGNAGLGKCELCGCSGMKHKLPDEQCPDKPPRWGKVEGVPWHQIK